jgi:hypothetical protein
MASGLFTLKQQVQALRQGAWSGQKPQAVQYLVVAGGGSGGYAGGGGGGAGGFLTGIVPVVTGSAITTTVGAGGTPTASNPIAGNTGSNSVFGNITVLGGGGGGAYGTYGGTNASKAGGSGGGGGSTTATGLTSPGGQGTSGQGNVGGIGAYGPTNAGGGGGGAGTAGYIASAGPGGGGGGGRGGAGIASAISGTVTVYAGGGGGGSGDGSGPGGVGGVGGGGNGGFGGSGVPTGGTPNTGGGGGGDWNAVSTAGSGGSGIVIVSYPDIYGAASAAPNATVSTSGSGSILNTSSSCITYPNNSAFDFGTGNFTIEGWIYSTVASSEQYLFSKRASATFTPMEFGVIASGANNRIYFLGSTSGSNWEINGSFATGSINIPVNTWTHIALVRNGSVFTSYVNGVADLTASNSSALMTNTSAVSIGASVIDGSNALIGNFTNVRVVKGTAVYTSNFTPSIVPLTAISGTSLLMNAVSGSLYTDSSTNTFTPTKVGTNSWNQLSPFATGLGYKNRVYTWTTSGSITF